MKNRSTVTYILLGISALIYLVLGYATQRTDFRQLLLLLSVCFGIYTYVINQRFPIAVGIGAAILFRLLFLFAIPQLSDDYFRFIWDGRLLAAGISPYLHLPSFFVQASAPAVPGISESLFQELNSPSYYSVYPPVAQGVFWLSATLFPDNSLGSIMIIRILIILAETGSIFILLRLLRKMGMADRNVFLYALNPLVIVELTGNLHFEALMIFFLLLSLYLLYYQRMLMAGGAFGLAIGIKLLPLLFMPLLWRRLGTKQFILFGTATLTTAILLSWPLITWEDLLNIFKSINLYFQHFEFNASIYYLLRWIGFKLTGYNQIALIGPLLSIATLVAVVYLAATKRLSSTKRTLGFMAAALTIYMLLATTVHPWYITTLVALTVVSQFRFAMVWSGLAVVSYAAYRTSVYKEDLALIAIEYLLVFLWLLVELYLYRQRSKTANLK